MPHKKTGSKKGLNIETYIVKIKNEVDKGLVLQKDARESLNGIIQCLVDKYLLSVVELLYRQEKLTACARDVQTVTNILLKGQLARHAVAQGTRANTLYMSYLPKKGKDRVSIAEKAGLVLSPARIESYVRKEIVDHKANARMSKNTAVYLAAVLEYIIGEIIGLCRKTVKPDKNHNRKVSMETLHEVIRKDNDMLGSLCSCL